MFPNTLLFVACLMAASFSVTSADGVENFVRLKMANYSTWIKANNLDPSPVLRTPAWFPISHQIMGMDGFLRDQAVSGHSDGILTVRYVNSNFGETSGNIEIGFDINGNITFYGRYNAAGTLIADMPISAGGAWHVNVNHISTGYFYFQLDANPQGYLDITFSFLNSITPDRDGLEINFAKFVEYGLTTGCKEEIRQALIRGFEIYMQSLDGNERQEHPLRTMYVQYWTQMFSETSFADIIATPPATAEIM